MSRLFGRTVLIQLGNASVGRSFQDLTVEFSVERTLTSEPNSANISVYNLDRSTVSEALGLDRELRVRLFAGYDTPSLLFDGFPEKDGGVQVEHDSVDRILKLRCKDGLRRYEKARVNKSIAAETSLEDVLVEVAGQLALPVDTIDVPKDAKLTQGAHLNGSAIDILDQIALSSNADWSVQDGKFQFLQRGSARRGQGPLFSSELGNIIGSPRSKDKGIEITTLIDGAIVPGATFRVSTEEGFYDGDYKARKVKYSGSSTYGGDFYATVYGVPYTTQAEGEKMARTQVTKILDIGRPLVEGTANILTELGDPTDTDIENDFGN